MTEPARLLHVWRIGADSWLFEAVTSLLRQTIERAGGAVEEDNRRDHVLWRVRGDSAWAALRDQVGVHRGQAAGALGRILTTFVGVEIVREGQPLQTGRPAGPVIQTYNKPLGWVLHHPTGARRDL